MSYIKKARPTAANETAAKKDDKENSVSDLIAPIDMLSLQSLGAYLLFDEIDNNSAKDLCEFIIKANYIFNKDQMLTILINSPGGSAYDGFGIIDMMDCSRIPIQTVGVGAIFSMATLILTAGKKGHRMMSRNSYIMTHQFSDYGEGKYHEFVAHRKHQDDLHRRFVDHFVKRTKMTKSQVENILLGKNDEYIEAKDALKFGLCDVVRDPFED